MAIQLTDEEKKKFDELLKEMGYDDHAKKVIEGVYAEAKTHREAREKTEAALKKLQEDYAELKGAEDKRVADQKKKDDDAAAAQKKLDDEKKNLDQRLDDLRTEIAGQFAEATTAQKAEVKALKDQIKERDDKIGQRDQRMLRETVRGIAEKRGIIDADIADHFDLKGIKMEDGVPDQEAIDKLIEEHATAKPHLYKEPDSRDRDDRGRYSRPTPGTSSKGAEVDAAALDDKAFGEMKERLAAGRV